jgi:hypothetical protein
MWPHWRIDFQPQRQHYGFGHILNNLAQQDRDVAESRRNRRSDCIATAYSNANPDTAYGLADLLRSVAYVKVDDFNAKVRAALDRDKLREFAKQEAFLEDAFIFSKFCASVVWWDENLALEMAELFVPTAQQVLAKDPVEGFHQLSHDFASTVLRVFDVLGVYVGQQKPTRRQLMIARRMCEKIDPKQVADHISTVRPRHFQSAGFFLHFLYQSAPRKYEVVLRQLDWEKLDSVIGTIGQICSRHRGAFGYALSGRRRGTSSEIHLRQGRPDRAFSTTPDADGAGSWPRASGQGRLAAPRTIRSPELGLRQHSLGPHRRGAPRIGRAGRHPLC